MGEYNLQGAMSFCDVTFGWNKKHADRNVDRNVAQNADRNVDRNVARNAARNVRHIRWTNR